MKTIFLNYGMDYLQIKSKNKNKKRMATTPKYCVNKLFREICLNKVYRFFLEDLISESA